MARIVGTTGPAPAAPKPPAPPKVSALTPQPAYVKPATPAQRTAATSTYRQAFGSPSGGYKGAVVHVFKAQPKPVQAQILKGALASGRSAEAKALLDYLKMGSAVRPLLASLKPLEPLGTTQRVSALTGLSDHLGYSGFALKLQNQYPQLKSLGSGYELAFRLMQADAKPPDAALIARTIGGEQKLPTFVASPLSKQPVSVSALTKQPGFVKPATKGQLQHASSLVPRAKGGPTETPPAKEPGGSGFLASVAGDLGLNPDTIAASLGQAGHIAGVTGQFLSKPAVNAAKDLVQLPAEAYSSIALPVGDIAHGRFGKAASDVVTPIVQAATHPLQMLSEHPLDTYLMLSGAAAGASRLAAAPLRALAPAESALGKALATERPGVALTGKLTHERVPASLAPTVKASQAAVDKTLYKRTAAGDLVPRSPFIREKLIRNEVGNLFSARERIRRVNREATIRQRESNLRPSKAHRVGHAAKTALAYNPDHAVIPGAEAYARVADLTVRNPTRESFVNDLMKHSEQVSATRPNLLDRPDLLKEHDAYIKSLQDMIKHPPTDKQLKVLLGKAEENRQQFAPVQEQLRKFGYFGADMSKEGLLRRELQHYAVTHMHARMDSELGLVDAAGKALPTKAILEHLNGPEGTKGRMPLYTPDRPRSGSAYYVNSERLPLPATAKNTLFAYTHGLTEPGHDALTAEHVLKQGILDAYKSNREYLDQLKVTDHGTWPTYKAATSGLRGTGLKPISISEPFHPADALEKAYEGIDPATLEEEASKRGLSLEDRMRSDAPGGRWAGIDPSTLAALKEHEGMVSPNKFLRTIRGLNSQFRTVALSTSAKHVPGVISEGIIRDISYGVSFRSWLTGTLIKGVWKKDLGEAGAREMRARYAGGQQAGMTEFARTHTTSQNYRGTNMYPVLKGWEAFRKAPGPRQARTLWLAWSKLVINGTKKAIEEQQQTATIGKFALKEHGYVDVARTQGFLSATRRLLTLHGQMLEDAAKGMYDPAKGRQVRAYTNRVMGVWTDLTPTTKTAIMFSPFGLWWLNSVRFLARMPVDQPVKTGLLASTTVGTEKQRQALGLSMFGPNRLPGYMQGAIPDGGKVIAQQYYSPFGVAGDPLETAQSLIEPWILPAIQGAGGVDYLFRPLSSPGHPRGSENPAFGQRAQYILDSLLSSFLPLYTKATQLVNGGASAYSVGDNPFGAGGNPFFPPTKTPGKGIAAGAEKAFRPWREYRRPAPKGSSGAWGAPSAPSSGSSNGWGAPSSSSSSSGNGWG